MSNDKAIPILKEIGIDCSIGTGSYLAILQLDWIQESQHIFIALVTALVCCAGVHYFRKILLWADAKIFKIKKDGKN